MENLTVTVRSESLSRGRTIWYYSAAVGAPPFRPPAIVVTGGASPLAGALRRTVASERDTLLVIGEEPAPHGWDPELWYVGAPWAAEVWEGIQARYQVRAVVHPEEEPPVEALAWLPSVLQGARGRGAREFLHRATGEISGAAMLRPLVLVVTASDARSGCGEPVNPMNRESSGNPDADPGRADVGRGDPPTADERKILVLRVGPVKGGEPGSYLPSGNGTGRATPLGIEITEASLPRKDAEACGRVTDRDRITVDDVVRAVYAGIRYLEAGGRSRAFDLTRGMDSIQEVLGGHPGGLERSPEHDAADPGKGGGLGD